jgi:transposase
MRPKGTAAGLEVRRRLAAVLLEEGKSVAEVAEIVQASQSSVRRWRLAWNRGGVEALASKPHPGPQPKLSGAQQRQLLRILTQGARAAGYLTELWTCRRVAEVVQEYFRVDYHPDHLGRMLRSLGWTPQKPERRARERNEVDIRCWRECDWPRIKKRGA